MLQAQSNLLTNHLLRSPPQIKIFQNKSDKLLFPCSSSCSCLATTDTRIYLKKQRKTLDLKSDNMFSLKLCKGHHNSPFLSNPYQLQQEAKTRCAHFAPCKILSPHKRKLGVRASGSGQGGEAAEKKGSERRPFLTLEEAGLVEISGLSTHERFLCRLTISSLNLLRVISEQEGCPIEELNAGKVCDWFVKDKLKREQNLDSAVLQWDDSSELL